MKKGLLDFLNQLHFYEALARNEKIHPFTIGDDFYTPSYWTVLAAYCRWQKIEFAKIKFCSEARSGYASAIALERAINETDGYEYERKNSGKTYSELVLLNSADDTDKATSTINGCIRHLFNTAGNSVFSKDLCDVVGDLHDNVWSHGKSTGFSMAQKWEDYSNRGQYYFEFALADCGLGFLSELKRVGLSVENDEDAINWCIQEGNSSKKSKTVDEWAQRLPADSSNNPMPNVGRIVTSENNHMGLGLAKLIALVMNYEGQLWLASGEKTLFISDGNKHFNKNSYSWQGVALACRFDSEKVKTYNKSNQDEVIDSLVEFLKA